MPRSLKFIFYLLFALFWQHSAYAQVSIDTSWTPERLVREVLLGGGVQVKNIRYKGAKRAIAHFTNKSGYPNIQRGVLLTTGVALDAKGPNTTSGKGSANIYPGDQQLQRIAKGKTYDACILQFDFVPSLDRVAFNFFFASEEYLEYVNTHFNDVFAFYISGPGISGYKNLAVLPKTGEPITINTVHIQKNEDSYIDNSIWTTKGRYIAAKADKVEKTLLDNFQYDGMTTLLTAKARVIPNRVYSIKIAIADVGDSYLDSGVFLQAKSFTSLITTPDPDLVSDFPNAEYQPVVNPWDNDDVPDNSAEGWISFPPDEIADTVSGLPEEVAEIPKTERKAIPVAEKAIKPEKPRPAVSSVGSVITFGFDSWEIPDSSKAALLEWYQATGGPPGLRVELRGHTDNMGAQGYNQRLSERRAGAVKDYLIRMGIREDNISLEGFSFSRPVEDNQTDKGRTANRRVEVLSK